MIIINKIYKFWVEGEKENFEYVAALSYNEALYIFKDEKNIKDLSISIKGKTLLKKNPSSRVDYLRLNVGKGVL